MSDYVKKQYTTVEGAGLPAPGRRASATVIITWTTAPGRWWASGTGTLLSIGQLDSYTTTTQGSETYHTNQ